MYFQSDWGHYFATFSPDVAMGFFLGALHACCTQDSGLSSHQKNYRRDWWSTGDKSSTGQDLKPEPLTFWTGVLLLHHC